MSLKRELDSQQDAYQAFRPKKKHRVYTDEDAKLAKIFDNLSSELKNVQLDAAIDLLKSYKENGGPEKIVVRLIRGLCSSRKAARPGFFIALTEVFKSVLEAGDNQTLLREGLSLVTKYTENERGAAKSEKKEHVLGRLAGYSALIHSHVIFGDYSNSGPDANSTPLFESFLQHLLSISKKAPHLTEQCGRLLVDIVGHASAAGSTAHIERLLLYLQKGDTLHTPNGLAVWMKALQSTPKIHFPVGVWEKNDPFHAHEIHRLTKALSNDYKIEELAGSDIEAKTKSTNHGTAREGGPKGTNHGIARKEPHFVWQVVLDNLIAKEPQENEKGSKKKDKSSEHARMKEFWLLAVDAPHFAPECSPERKALGFRIFALAIARLPDHHFVQVLSPQLLRCLVNQQADADRYLHQIANDILERLAERIRNDMYPMTLRETVLALNRNEQQDSVARGAKINILVNRLLSAASAQAVEKLLPEYETRITEALATGIAPKNGIASDLAVVASQLSILFRAIPNDGTTSCREPHMAVLRVLHIGAFEAERSASPLPAQRKLFQVQLWSCIKDVFEDLGPGGLLTPLDVALIDCAVTPKTSDHVAKHSDVELLQKARTLRHAFLDLPSKDQTSSFTLARHSALYLLLSLSQLEVLTGEPDASAALADIVDCSEDFDADTRVCDKIVDIILAMLSKPDSVFRLAAENAFSAFAPTISADGLAGLFHILSREENIAGQRDLFDQQADEGDDNSSSHDSASDVEDASDVEVLEAGADVDEESRSEDDDDDDDSQKDQDDSSEEGSDDDDDEANSGDEALNATLGDILRTRNADAAGDSDSDSDSDMTDSAMETLNIDAQLSTIFKQRAASSSSGTGAATRENKKASQLEAKRVIVTFKSRILGLLNLYIATQYSRTDCLSVILPLCQLIGSTRNAQIARKSDDALERYIKLAKKKHGLPVGVQAEEAWIMLAELHEEALLYRSKMHATACGRGALFLARVLVDKARAENAPDKQEKAVAKVVKKLKKQIETTRGRKEELGSLLPETFWENWGVWLTSMALK